MTIWGLFQRNNSFISNFIIFNSIYYNKLIHHTFYTSTKKRRVLQNVNTGYIKSLPHAETTEIELECVEPAAAAEMNEMGSFYYDKKHRLCVWHAIDHQTGMVSAYTFGTREHTVLDELLTLLKPYKIGKVYADHNFAYESRITGSILEQGKKNTQRIERKHPTLRTRVKRPARKSLCFSKEAMIKSNGGFNHCFLPCNCVMK